LHTNVVIAQTGSVYLSFETNQINQTAQWILQFGEKAKALNPPVLVEEIKLITERIIEKYK